MNKVLTFLIFTHILLSVLVHSSPIEEEWSNFKVRFRKTYKTPAEENYRFQIFSENLKLIQEHNEKYFKGRSLHKLEINRFADISKEELLHTNIRNKYRKHISNQIKETRLDGKRDIPDAFDWRSQNIGVNSAARDQYWCLHAFWAFSAVEAIESQNAILNGNLERLSVQQLLDCSQDFGNDGCKKGSVISAFQYVEFNGLNTEESYPYSAAENGTYGKCKATNESVVEVTGYRTIKSTENDLKAAVATIGPITASIYLSPVLLYKGGVFSSSDCVSDLNLLDGSVLVVGYGTEPATNTTPAQDYWILKMSWGDTWGENGYLRLARGSHQCGIALDLSYPVVTKKNTIK